MGALGKTPGGADGVRVEVGDAMHGDQAVLVAEEHRSADRADVGAQMDAGRVDQSRGEAEAVCGVMVAAGQDNGCP